MRYIRMQSIHTLMCVPNKTIRFYTTDRPIPGPPSYSLYPKSIAHPNTREVYGRGAKLDVAKTLESIDVLLILMSIGMIHGQYTYISIYFSPIMKHAVTQYVILLQTLNINWATLVGRMIPNWLWFDVWPKDILATRTTHTHTRWDRIDSVRVSTHKHSYAVYQWRIHFAHSNRLHPQRLIYASGSYRTHFPYH